MAETIIPVGASSSFTSKVWSAKLYQDTIMGDPIIADALSDGVIMQQNDLVRGAGDRIRMNFSKRLTGTGIIGDAPKRPNQKQIQHAYDDVNIEKLSSDPVYAKIEGTISQQRTAFDLDTTSYPSVSDWFKQRMISGFFNQLGGNTASSIAFDGATYTGSNLIGITGMNATTAPSSNRVFFATGSTDAAVGASSSATLTLQAIDELEEEAGTQRTGVNNFIPLIGKGYKYKFYVAESAFKQLKQQAQVNGNLTLPQIMLQQESSGKNATALLDDSFQYSKTLVISVPNHYMPTGITSGAAQLNTKRAIFTGAGAACLAFGKGYSDKKETIAGFKILNDNDDIEETRITVATGIFGLKKTVIDGVDQSAMTYTHYIA